MMFFSVLGTCVLSTKARILSISRSHGQLKEGKSQITVSGISFSQALYPLYPKTLQGVKPNPTILNLYISEGHNFIGHHGKPPGNHPTIEKRELHCLAGRGIDGDRFLDHQRNDKSHITFFELEAYDYLCTRLNRWDLPPSVFRRNVITSGIRLNDLIDKEFEIQGIRFKGIEECRPCYWMDQVFGAGTEQAMQGKGGLRACILTDGFLHSNSLEIMKPDVSSSGSPTTDRSLFPNHT